jgi:hypothetical protein
MQTQALYVEIDDFDASEIASAWHSVMTWNDPGVAMYSVTSTGKVHSETHRANLIAYIDNRCMPSAIAADERGDEGIRHPTNVADLEALRTWALAYEIDTNNTNEEG